MHISNFKLKNYASFLQEDNEDRDVALGKNMNFIVGQNNSGKTALLEALSPQSRNGDSPARIHRSAVTVPEVGVRDERHTSTKYEIEYSFSAKEILRNFRQNGLFYLMRPGRLSDNAAERFITEFQEQGTDR